MNKSVLIVNKFFDPHVGGIETVVHQHADWFSRDGWDVRVLVFLDKKSGSFKGGGNFEVIEVPPLFVFKKLPFSFKFLWQFFVLARSSDVVIGHYPFPLFDFLVSILPFRNKKFFLYWHSDIISQRYLRMVVHPFTKILLRRSKVAVTSARLKQSSKYLRDINCDIIPLCIDFSKYPFEPLSVGPDGLNIYDDLGRELPERFSLFFGRLTSYKNVSWVLKLAEKFPDKDFVICGNGDDAVLVRSVLDKGVKNIYWISRFLSHYEKLSLFYCANLYLFPSNMETEAFGITQLESLAMGTPVLNQDLNSGVPSVTDGIPYCLTSVRHNFDDYLSKFENLVSLELDLEQRREIRRSIMAMFNENLISQRTLDFARD